jgi:hypothetical protein
MLVDGESTLSRTQLRRMLGTDTPSDAPEIDLLLADIEQRRSTAPRIYPFERSGSGVALVGAPGRILYEFLLWLSNEEAPYRREDRYNEVAELFDVLTREALSAYFGPAAIGVRFAHPSTDGRPPGFPEAVSWLADLLNLSTGSAERRPARRDGGVDVVVWSPFRDGRPGFSALLVQCTVSLTWWTKSSDIRVDRWRGWIDFGRDPLTALAVPFAVPASYDRWDELRRDVTIVLDRLRMCELLESIDPLPNLEPITSWIDAERAKIAASVP